MPSLHPSQGEIVSYDIEIMKKSASVLPPVSSLCQVTAETARRRPVPPLSPAGVERSAPDLAVTGEEDVGAETYIIRCIIVINLIKVFQISSKIFIMSSNTRL